MKTSINVPDWLHDQAQDMNPDVPFGQLVRDALLIALKTWRASEGASSVERELRMRLREESARRGREAEQAAQAAQDLLARRRQRARKAPAPGAKQGRPQGAARKSSTTASAPSPRRRAPQ